MSELELRLQALGAELDFPDTPDVALALRPRLTAPRRGFPRRRALATAIAILVVAVGAMLAIPPARTAILDWLGIGSAEIRIVDELPELDEAPLNPGEPASLAEARRLVPGLLEPRLQGLGKPDAVYVRSFEPGTPVTFLWGDREHPRLILTQVRGSYSFEKLVLDQPGGVVTSRVNGAPAVWIEGKPHVVFFLTEEGYDGVLESRLATNTLVWSRGPTTLRLEGELTREEAERIARSVR